jgi:hypothetical protein
MPVLGYKSGTPGHVSTITLTASGFGHRAMVIAMSIVGIMKMPIDKVINMVAMRN